MKIGSFQIAIWCSGNTASSDLAIGGSNPSLATSDFFHLFLIFRLIKMIVKFISIVPPSP